MTVTAQRIKVFFVSLVRIASMFILLPQVVYFAIRLSLIWEAYEGSKAEIFPAWVCLITLVFFSFSYIKVEAAYDMPLRERFFEAGADPSFKGRLAFFVKRPEPWIKAAVIGLIYVLLPLEWTLAPLVEVTLGLSAPHRLLSVAGLLAVLFFSAALASLSAYKRWGSERGREDYGKKGYNRESSFVIAVYGMGSGMLIATLPVVWPIISVILGSLTVGRVIFICVLACLPALFRSVRALRKRKAFFKELAQVCREKGYTLSPVQKPYLSVFRLAGGESFTLDVGNGTYSCKLISGRKKRLPIVLAADGTLSYLHSVRIRSAVLYEHTTTYDISYPSPHPKILIINPVPGFVGCVHGGKLIELDNGAVVGDFKLYAATGFLRAAELKVLHK